MKFVIFIAETFQALTLFEVFFYILKRLYLKVCEESENGMMMWFEIN